MIDLSPRLQMVASMVPNCKTAADVGTDHAYLAVRLLSDGVVAHVLATDIHAGPLARAKQTASACDMTGRMEFHLCDGLQFPGAELADTIVIAGMGGETMVSILQAAPWAWENRALILQPQSKQRLLYQWLSDHKICLRQAKLCMDAGKLYLAFLAMGQGEGQESVEDLLLAAKDPLLPIYLESEENRLCYASEAMQKASRDMRSQLDAIKEQLAYLEHYRKAVESW